MKGMIMNNYVKSIVAGAVAGVALITVDSAYAGEVTVQDFTKTVVHTIPHTERQCHTVEVPIYGEERFDQGNAIVGGIVGGLLGSQIGKGSGNKVATGVGAMTGAIIGGKKEGGVVGYRQEERCKNNTTYTKEYEEVYSHSVAGFYHEGRYYKVKFQK
jgi:uncharacterized protein YcfJ